MNKLSHQLAVSLATAVIALAGAASAVAAGEQPQFNAAGMLVAPNGMTLYVFDKDAPGKSNCAGGCLAAWPALMLKEPAELKAPFSAVTREDGFKQVAWQGKPLYFYAADQKAGDVAGDNSGGVWHVVRKDAAKTSSAPADAHGSSYGSSYKY
jgi:predicted lipoprotein with Yx(FWY)xxD motif